MNTSTNHRATRHLIVLCCNRIYISNKLLGTFFFQNTSAIFFIDGKIDSKLKLN